MSMPPGPTTTPSYSDGCSLLLRSPHDRSGAHTDHELVALWLANHRPLTQQAYLHDIDSFLEHAGVPLRQVTLADVRAWADQLTGKPGTRRRKLAAVKSLLTFAEQTGYLPYNVGRAMRLPQDERALAERILSPVQTHRLLAASGRHRDRVLLLVLYASGGRVSELCGLRWSQTAERADGEGQLTLHGKGGHVRSVVLPASVWSELLSLRDPAVAGDGPVFVSRRGGAMGRVAVYAVVRQAARRAQLGVAASPHWLRHAHASHALDRGAPISLVQATLGHASVATTGTYLHARPGESSSRFLGL